MLHSCRFRQLPLVTNAIAHYLHAKQLLARSMDKTTFQCTLSNVEQLNRMDVPAASYLLLLVTISMR